tara:strand:+ start:515 stop:673 length:159 start_codon:yes stop_codon:yes gene_type:complete
MIDIDMMIRLLKMSSRLMGNLNGDTITSLNKMVLLKTDIDDLINKIEREENE